MNGRERILTALAGGVPDRMPRALGFFRVDIESRAPPGTALEACVDVQFVRFAASPEEEAWYRIARPFPPDTRLGSSEQMATYVRWHYRPEAPPEQRNPLALAQSLDEIREFPFPDVSALRQRDDLKTEVDALHAKGLAVGGNLPHLGGELFETAWRLRGLENFLLDLIERPAWAHFLLDRLTDIACYNVDTLVRSGIDVLALDDDVGMPGTMMMGPAMWRAFFKPRLARIVDTARHVNPSLYVLFHSDGYFEPILVDLVDIGVNAINPLQPEHMDAARIRRRFGPSLALWGTVGYQTTFSYARPDQIRREVAHRVETLGRAGLILSPAYDIDEPDISWENIAAFLDAAASV